MKYFAANVLKRVCEITVVKTFYHIELKRLGSAVLEMVLKFFFLFNKKYKFLNLNHDILIRICNKINCKRDNHPAKAKWSGLSIYREMYGL